MKIGLLTFHFPINYGAMLQTYALYFFLEQEGIEVEIINFFTKERKKDYNYFQKPKTIKNLLHNYVKFLFWPHYIFKVYKFRKFKLSHFRLTRRYKNLKYVSFNYDVVITGSDQVFNLNRNDNLIYFQPFSKSDKQRKIAYAPSFGINDFNKRFIDKISPYVIDFDFLSCREDNGAELLQKITGMNVPNVLDPVFLLDDNEWSKICNKRLINDKYILIYDLNGKKSLIEIANKIEDNYILVIVSNDPIAKIRKSYRNVDKFIMSAGIEDFVSLIKYSEYVITDSFHGISMSIIFRKVFFTFIALETVSNRIISLLDNLSLSDRIVWDINTFDFNRIIKYKEDILASHISHSKKYLINSLYE